jgi:hypothetical protein
MMEWQPIETAPRDGTIICVWMPHWNGRGPLIRTMWHCGFWWNEFLNGSAPSNFHPEYWANFPEGPRKDKD